MNFYGRQSKHAHSPLTDVYLLILISGPTLLPSSTLSQCPIISTGFFHLSSEVSHTQREKERERERESERERETLGLHTLRLHATLVHLSSLSTDTLTSRAPAAALTIEGLQLFREGHSLRDDPMELWCVGLHASGSTWLRIKDPGRREIKNKDSKRF